MRALFVAILCLCLTVASRAQGIQAWQLDSGSVMTLTTTALTVGETGSQFTSLKTALDSIVDAGALNPYVVQVAAGIYDEDPFTVPSYVTIRGAGDSQSVVLRTTTNSAHFITGSPNATLMNVSIDGPTNTGFAAVYHDAEDTDPFFLRYVLIRKGYYGVWVNPASASGLVHAFHLGNEYAGSPMEQFVRVTGYGNFTGMNVAVMHGPPGYVDTGFYADGANARLTIDVGAFRDPGSMTGVFANNGADVRLIGTTFSDGVTAIHVGPTGDTHLDASSCVISHNFTNHIFIQSSLAEVAFTGEAQRDKMVYPEGMIFGAAFVDDDPAVAGQVVIGELWLQNSSAFPLASYAKSWGATGLSYGGTMSHGGGLDVEVAAGQGFIGAFDSVQRTQWTTTTYTIPANADDLTLYVDGNGDIQHTTFHVSHEDFLVLGAAATNATTIVLLGNHTVHLPQTPARIHEFIADAIGPVSISGMMVTTHSPPSLQVDVDSGSYFIHDNRVSVAEMNPATWTAWYRNGSGGWVKTPALNDVDDDFYDDSSGTLAAIPAGKWKKDVLYNFESDDGSNCHLVYGQEIFDTEEDAILGSLPVTPDVISRQGFRFAGLVVQQGDGKLSSVVDHRPRVGTSSPGTTSSSDHGNLFGLGDDDHPQYQLRSEEGAASGYAALDGTAKVPTTQLPFDTATWNANKIQGITVDGAAIADRYLLKYNSGTGNLEYASQSDIDNTQLAQTDDTSTTSSTYVTISGMTTTPAAGTYLATFSTSGSSDNLAATFLFGIHVGGTLVAHSEREVDQGAAGDDIPLFTQAIITVNGGQTVDVQYQTSSGTLTVHERSLVLLRLGD